MKVIGKKGRRILVKVGEDHRGELVRVWHTRVQRFVAPAASLGAHVKREAWPDIRGTSLAMGLTRDIMSLYDPAKDAWKDDGNEGILR
jgi:hypothetical protein